MYRELLVAVNVCVSVLFEDEKVYTNSAHTHTSCLLFVVDGRTSYREYIHNLDKLAVYVDSKGGQEQIDQQVKMCGFVSRLNDAVFKPRLHVQCLRPLEGRYVYIEAWGVPSRWTRLFSVVLCEVMVYQ